jgi:short-subunit dehydrogenase
MNTQFISFQLPLRKHLFAAFAKHNSGNITVISSIAGLIPLRSGYAASKHA